MKPIRRTITGVLLCVALLFTTAVPALANDNPIISEWAKEEVAAAEDAGLLPFELTGNCSGAINRSQTVVFVVKFIETTIDKEITVSDSAPFTDTGDMQSSIEIAKAYAAGIVKGTGNGVFEPSRLVSREEFCVMLHRAVAYIESITANSVMPTNGDISSFSDAGLVSEWARAPLGVMVKAGVWRGVSNTQLAPKANVSMEQTIVLIYRCFDYMNTDDLSRMFSALVKEKIPVRLALTMNGTAVGEYDGWGCANDVYLSRFLTSYTYKDALLSDLPTQGNQITLTKNDGGHSLSVDFFEGSNYLRVNADGTTAYYEAIQPESYAGRTLISDMLRIWYDEAEWKGVGGDNYERQSPITIADKGQGYLEAAREFSEVFEGKHLYVTSGSRFLYTYVSCQTEAAEEATRSARARGEIDENTYAFFVTTVFVPENERALNYSMAGNTAEYTGKDPDVPAGAFEYYRCGYITLAEDGWHGVIVGTGW